MNVGRVLVRTVAFLVALGVVAVVGFLIYEKIVERRAAADEGANSGGERVAPVEVARVEHGPLELRRVFSGTLEARARFDVAPRIGGRVTRLTVDLADPVRRGEVVAELDDDEHQNELAQAQAGLAVARANLAEAQPRHETARRALDRVEDLRDRGVFTESEYDEALAESLVSAAAVTVAEAEIRRAEADVATANTRLGYTRVTATWTGGSDVRYVAERFVDVGDTVSMGAPIVAIVELDPLLAVIHVTERDHRLLRTGQAATLTTDAMPGETFPAVIQRIAPVFRSASRQARVELSVANPDLLLKPGVFVRAEVLLDRVEDATIVPESALATRSDETGVFVVDEAGTRVRWLPVEIGIQQGDRVQILGDAPLEGRVVTLGHQLIDDGSAIVIPGADPEPAETRAR